MWFSQLMHSSIRVLVVSMMKMIMAVMLQQNLKMISILPLSVCPDIRPVAHSSTSDTNEPGKNKTSQDFCFEPTNPKTKKSETKVCVKICREEKAQLTWSELGVNVPWSHYFLTAFWEKAHIYITLIYIVHSIILWALKGSTYWQGQSRRMRRGGGRRRRWGWSRRRQAIVVLPRKLAGRSKLVERWIERNTKKIWTCSSVKFCGAWGILCWFLPAL